MMRLHRPASPSLSGVRKGSWTLEEDALLKEYVEMHGARNWRNVSQRAGLNRCRKSCRMRWLNYLCPSIKRGPFEEDEEDLIMRLHKLLGNRWSLIAGRLPCRTANDVKNHWNTHLRKRLDVQSKKEKNENFRVIKPQPRLIPANWVWSSDQLLTREHKLASLLEHNPAHEDRLEIMEEFDCPTFGIGGEAEEEDLQTNTGVEDTWRIGDEVFLTPEVTGGCEKWYLDANFLEGLFSV